MIWVGITGPMGGGKSSVADLIKSRGFNVINADEVVHGLLRAGGAACSEIFSTFGEFLKTGSGDVDRQALGRVVFGDPAKLDLLEKILHPKVRHEVARLKQNLAATGAKAGFYDVPLLFEKKMEDQFDVILVVTASESVRMRRLVARTGLSESEITQRWRSQLPPEYKEQRADYVIRNDGDRAALGRAVDDVLKRMGILPAATKS